MATPTHALTAAIIHPDGFLMPLRGTFQTDLASIAALAHAVHAAGHELSIRTGTAPTHSITLAGSPRSLTLLPTPRGILLIEHASSLDAESLKPLVSELLNITPPAAATPSLPAIPAMSLTDALYATAP